MQVRARGGAHSAGVSLTCMTLLRPPTTRLARRQATLRVSLMHEIFSTSSLKASELLVLLDRVWSEEWTEGMHQRELLLSTADQVAC